jgi:hypothetical protein
VSVPLAVSYKNRLLVSAGALSVHSEEAAMGVDGSLLIEAVGDGVGSGGVGASATLT